ncbi:MAG: hypothetical protein WCQ47_00245 [bacterium]
MLRIITVMFILSSVAITAMAQDSDTAATDRRKPIGSVIVFRGDDVSVYGGGKKNDLNEKKMPYALYPGDEIGTGLSSDCEILLNTDDTIYVSADSLIGLDFSGANSTKLFLRYGIIMFKGNSPMELISKDFSGYSIGGDFIFKYKRSSFETIVYNLGKDMRVKRDMDKNYVVLNNNNFSRLSSFKNGRDFGIIKKGSIPIMYKTFRISFRPGGKTSDSEEVPSSSASEIRPLPYTSSANLDTIKRAIGL